MNIELKNIKLGPHALSRETVNFVADIYFDNKKVGFAYNDGGGGQTTYRPDPFTPQNKEIIKEAEQWALTLPPVKSEVGDLKMDFGFWIDCEIDKYVNAKELAKMAKKCDKSIIIYNESEGYYRQVDFKRPLSEILKDEKGIAYLKSTTIPKMVSNLKNGEVIINDNIKHLMPEPIQVKS